MRYEVGSRAGASANSLFLTLRCPLREPRCLSRVLRCPLRGLRCVRD